VTIHDAVHAWVASAITDAERRGLLELNPLLQALAAVTEQLRRADWNDDASGRQAPGPAIRPRE